MTPAAGKSGSDVEQLGYESSVGPHVASANPPYVPLSHHRHHLVACQGSSRRPEAAEAEPRSDQAFYAPMILFGWARWLKLFMLPFSTGHPLPVRA